MTSPSLAGRQISDRHLSQHLKSEPISPPPRYAPNVFLCSDPTPATESLSDPPRPAMQAPHPCNSLAAHGERDTLGLLMPSLTPGFAKSSCSLLQPRDSVGAGEQHTLLVLVEKAAEQLLQTHVPPSPRSFLQSRGCLPSWINWLSSKPGCLKHARRNPKPQMRADSPSSSEKTEAGLLSAHLVTLL